MPVQRRHRSAVACHNCRRRKVRCSVTVTGVPCSNCTQDRVTCTIQETSHKLPRDALSMPTRQEFPAEASLVATDSRTTPETAYQMPPSYHASQAYNSRASAPTMFSAANAVQDDVNHRFDSERQRDLYEEQSGAELSYAARGQGNSNSGTPFYTGEQPGVTSLIDVQQPLPRHIMLKPSPPRAIPQANYEFLQRKGALSPLLIDSHREILRAYFHHVHPMLPILHLVKLQDLELPEAIPPHGMLLYWSMAVVAVNFVPNSVWKAENFTSRKDMKDTMYDRAKCMYDNSGETDKEVLLQVALLLSFWHSEKDSHTQPWYWSGVAINWCQIIGLHRDPDAARVNSLVLPQRRNLWQRMWASCLFRDRWLSLTLGRPLRIHLNDCDMPFPALEDVMNDLNLLSSELRKLILGEILALFYQQLANTPTLLQFDNLESELSSFIIPAPHSTRQSGLAMFSYHHLQLHYQAILIIFYRPFVSTVPQGLLSEAEETWKTRVRSRLEIAATTSNSILDCLAREDLVRFATPMTPPLLVPAMHVHLLSCKSENHLNRRLAFNKLEMCMTIMRELQKTHTSASIFCGVFGEAIRQIVPGPLDETIWGVSQIRRATITAPVASESLSAANIANYAAQPVITDDLLESLLNETSTYNFWESINLTDQSFTEYRGL